MPLVDPKPEAATPELTELYRFFNKTLGFAPNSVMTMQRKPGLAEAFVNLNKAAMAGPIPSEFKRLLAHISSKAAGCRYCQAHTVLGARNFGETDERLNEIWNYETSDKFTDKEKAALDFALAASSVPNAVDGEIARNLKAHWSDDEIVELLGVIALFGFLNRWNDSMATEIEAPAQSLAEATLGKVWEVGKHGG